MKIGWVKDNETWYYLQPSGAMKTGVVEVDEKVYCLAPSGQAIGDKIPTPTVAFTSGGTEVTPSETTGTTSGTGSSSSSGSSSGGGSSSSSKSFQ